MIQLSQKHIAIAVVMMSFLLACAITWPVILSPHDLLVGHPGNDTWNHVWGYWWVKEAVLSGEWPSDADLLAFPNGGTLYFIDTIQAIVSLPIAIIFGSEVAFNAVMIAEIMLAGIAAWLLAYKVTSDHYASFAALFLFELSAHLLGQTYNGISETVCAGWFPLTIWSLLRMMEHPTKNRAITLGILGGVCVLTSWYYGLFAILASLIVLIWLTLKRGWLYSFKEISKGLGIAFIIAFLIVLGPVLSFRNSLSAENAIVTRDPEFVERSLLNHNITDVKAFVEMTQIPSPNLQELYGEELMIVIYLGWIGLLLAGYGIWSERRKDDWRMWAWLGSLFFIFCLGPYLHVGGEYLLVQGKRIPLPFLVLYKAFPVFDRISHPFRFVVGVNLAIAVLASQGLRVLLRRRTQLIKMVIIACLSLGIWLEIDHLSPAVLPIPHAQSGISQAYEDMKKDSIQGAVLDVPLSLPNLERAIYVWNQSVHKRAIPWGLNDPMPKALRQNILTQILLKIEGSHARSLPAVLPELDLVISSRVFARQGYRYIVVHEEFYPEFKLKQVHQLLKALFGEGQKYEDDVVVYTIDAIADAQQSQSEVFEMENLGASE